MTPIASAKVVSSLEKCFLDEKLTDKVGRDHYVMFRNQRLSFQAVFHVDVHESPNVAFYTVQLDGELARYAKMREVISMPVHYPVAKHRCDDNYLRYTPGLYPDMLRPFNYGGRIRLPQDQTRAVWIDIEIPEGAEIPVDESRIGIKLFRDEDIFITETEAFVRVSDISLPKQKLIHTEWFYTDCIAEAYHCRPFSEKHWRVTEKYVRTAVENGINLIMMPLFTPELDTYIGGERLTTQLVDITVTEEGKYQFNFDKVGRWVDMCLRCGVDYFEIPHFFTQWGAKHAPKFVAKVNGRTKRIFGWETDSMGDEYGKFLATLIPAFVEYMKSKGVDKRCYYHISDEPQLEHLDRYLECKKRVAPYLEGYNIIDALSSFEFYSKGVLAKPVPGIKHIHPFLEADIPGLWAYYCGAGGKVDTTDRYLSMPLARTRIWGVQLYRHNIEGFLHWGYNYYHNQYSYDYVDPYGNTDGESFAPAGDGFVVYPGKDEEVYESMRLNALREGVDDMRALDLYEQAFGRDAALELIGELDFFKYPKDAEYLLSLREKIILALENI